MSRTLESEIIRDGLERVSDTARFLGMSRSYVYRLIKDGVIPSVKIGKSRRVPVRAVRQLALDNMVSVPSVGT